MSIWCLQTWIVHFGIFAPFLGGNVRCWSNRATFPLDRHCKQVNEGKTNRDTSHAGASLPVFWVCPPTSVGSPNLASVNLNVGEVGRNKAVRYIRIGRQFVFFNKLYANGVALCSQKHEHPSSLKFSPLVRNTSHQLPWLLSILN